jgi:hypothetical protein
VYSAKYADALRISLVRSYEHSYLLHIIRCSDCPSNNYPSGTQYAVHIVCGAHSRYLLMFLTLGHIE